MVEAIEAIDRAGFATAYKLRPGPGRPPEMVADDQRARIHRATIEIVALDGYDAVTIRELARRAGVSTRALYQHFDGKEDCFLSTYDLVERRTARQVLRAYRSGGDWEGRLRLGIRAFALELDRDPLAARFCFAESFAAGRPGFARIQHTASLFAAMIQESFDHAPDRIAVPPIVVRGAVSGLAHVARSRLLTGREGELPELSDQLMDWVLCLRDGAAAELTQPSEPSVAPRREARAAPVDERELILGAASKLAVNDGYGQLSVSRIRAATGISRGSFDKHFEDATECFLAALEFQTDRALERAMSEGGARSDSWAGGVHGTVAALCADVARDPVLARLAFLEVFASGPEGMLRLGRLADAGVAAFRASAPAEQRPTLLKAEASLGAVWGMFHHYIAEGCAQRLPRRSGLLSYLALAPAIGAPAAVAAIQEEEQVRQMTGQEKNLVGGA